MEGEVDLSMIPSVLPGAPAEEKQVPAHDAAPTRALGFFGC